MEWSRRMALAPKVEHTLASPPLASQDAWGDRPSTPAQGTRSGGRPFDPQMVTG